MSADMQRERDLVLNPNESAYVLDKTKGLISCVVGPYKMSLSTSDALVVFNEGSKRFVESNTGNAIKTFVSAPENWYIVLKNPAKDENKHPIPGTSNALPDLLIGKKVNIKGNASFALYPGQMAKVIQGHRLHSNQYLLARVYDTTDLNVDGKTTNASVNNVNHETDENDKNKEEKCVQTKKYEVGQILVIKGSEVPFYIPPTGIEVIPIDDRGSEYVRNAVTLERLEYCILKNENGTKKYVHGPAVVFPEPDEEFIRNGNSFKFKAIELSEISGIYIKIISDYKEEDKEYKAGDELFITGNEQMIYYPRAEHSIITYDGKVVHHAIAIPKGEGRYVLDRKTGDIKMVQGPIMYLPDPRKEVVVKRKLTEDQCKLWYPGNTEVLEYNLTDHDNNLAGYMKNNNMLANSFNRDAISATAIPRERFNTRGVNYDVSVTADTSKSFSSAIYSDTLSTSWLDDSTAFNDPSKYPDPVVEEGISRGSSYSKPRTIVIDNKYDGVVTIDIWTGYAINVISKNGNRKVVIGPTTYLMEYDETLEALRLSTGKPKTTDRLLKTAFLRVENNKISDVIEVETKDFVKVAIKVSYCVDFLESYKNKWFSIENYVKYMTDRERSLIKREAKRYDIEEFYGNITDIVRNIALNLKSETECESESSCGRAGRFFRENGMLVHDVEILQVTIDPEFQELVESHQKSIIEKSLNLTNMKKENEVAALLSKMEKEKAELENQAKMYKLELDNRYSMEQIKKEDELLKEKRKMENEEKEAEKAIQKTLDEIQSAILARRKKENDEKISYQKKMDDLEATRQFNRATSIASVMESISPELVAAMTETSNANLVMTIAESMAPYAIASGQSVTDTVNTLLRGTSLEKFLEKIKTEEK